MALSMNTALIVTTQKEERIKKRLQKSIEKKRQTLEAWMEKVETLKIELELIKNEYAVRIGYLLLKDNQLDLEIIQYKNLKRLMDEGMTYEEAVKAEEDKFYNEILRIQKEQEKLEDEKSFFEKRQEIALDVRENIKTLWKKLIRKFHPDLEIDPKEKLVKEKLMKHINKAYAEGNYDELLELENHADIENAQDQSVEKLEHILVQTENLIQKTKQTFIDLRESQWYEWKKRMDKAGGQDVFAELERKLLDDVVKKITVLRELRAFVVPSVGKIDNE